MNKPEQAFLVGLRYTDTKDRESERMVCEHLQELKSLCYTMGVDVSGQDIANVRIPRPRYLLGEGKVSEICEAAKSSGCSLIVFDDDLSPSQQRNWEELSGLCVIDRQEVILEIFAQRARTREAVLQVALARLEYSLPRLTRAWTHLSRQRGGARGTKGEGETQLESDRRVIVRKIASVKRELEAVKKQRTVQRKQRQAVPVPVVSLVGYTNAGKSSLLKTLTGADVLIEDKLFATLDPTTRRIRSIAEQGRSAALITEVQAPMSLDGKESERSERLTPPRADFLLSDTVGFIRKLPHTLVVSFNSTLEEVLQADLLLHVVDAANPDWANQYAATEAVLTEIGIGDKPVITVFNKIDLITDPMDAFFLRKRFPEALFVSAKSAEGLNELVETVSLHLRGKQKQLRLAIPADRWDLVAFIHRQGYVIEQECADSLIKMYVRLHEKDFHMVSDYIAREHV